MAPSLLNNLRACGIALSVALAVEAQEQREPEALVFAAESLTLDRQTNLIQSVKPRISQGNLRIEADEALATGIEFEAQSEWRFTGHVRIAVGTATIEADSAVFIFEQERLARGELEGTPASFSDFDEARQTTIRGRARKLSYDTVAGTLRLTDNAWVQRDRVEMQGCDLIYDFTAERVTSGSADCADLFRVRVLPDSDEGSPPTDAPQ